MTYRRQLPVCLPACLPPGPFQLRVCSVTEVTGARAARLCHPIVLHLSGSPLVGDAAHFHTARRVPVATDDCQHLRPEQTPIGQDYVTGRRSTVTG